MVLKEGQGFNSRTIKILILGVAITVAGLFLTSDEALHRTSAKPEHVRVLAETDRTNIVNNALIISQNQEVIEVVRYHYDNLAKDTEFVERYVSNQIYTKLGPYQNSYIVFISYEVKLTGVETRIPGLESLYLERREDGKLHIVRNIDDEYVTRFMRKILQHEDIQILIRDIQERYDEIIASDDQVRRVLEQIGQPYEDTSDSGRNSGS